MNLILLLAAVLTFNNTSPEAVWFSIVQVQSDMTQRPIVYLRDHPNPGVVGRVEITLPGVSGDCFFVTAMSRSGPSGWSNQACLPAVIANPPSAPTDAGVK